MRAELSEDASAASEGQGHMHMVWVVRSWAEKMTQAVTPILKLRGRRASKRRACTLLFVQRGPAVRGLAGLALLPSQLL